MLKFIENFRIKLKTRYMKKVLLLITCAFVHLHGFSQDYIYSFEGTFDVQLIEQFESKLNAVTGVKECKVKIKEDTDKGQILIYLKQDVLATNLEQQFTPTDIKKLILEHQLTPIQFIESK